MLEERIKEAIRNLNYFGDWFYCDIPDKEEYLRMSQIIIDIKNLIRELEEEAK